MYNAAPAYKTAAYLSCQLNIFLKRSSINEEVGQNAVNWANESTYRSPYCAQSSFSRETSGESTAMLLQKENLYVVKGSAGMN